MIYMRVSKIIFLLFGVALNGYSQKINKAIVSNIQETTGVSTINANKQISKTVESSDCVLETGNEVNVINTIIKGGSAGCLEINATDFIDINEFFDSEYGSSFDAKIVQATTPDPTPDPIPTPEPTPTPDPTPIDDSNKQCEDFSNHGAANPHLYAKKSSYSFVGDMISKYAPEYRIEGLTGWKLTTTAGPVKAGSDIKYHYYEEKSDGQARYTFLRTKAGCTEYGDVRSQKVYDNTLEDWTTLPTNLQPMNPKIMDYYIFVNSDLEGKGINGALPIYNLFADRDIPNLNVRINGNDYHGFSSHTYPMFKVRDNSNKMLTNSINVTKDFVMDISDDGYTTGSRYTVYRNYLGGHYSTATTMTRHDGRVTVSVTGINWEIDQLLVNVNTGASFGSIATFGNVFDLGNLPDGDYQFSLKTYQGNTINNRVIVKVKRPSI
jgi:hypothetical protein